MWIQDSLGHGGDSPIIDNVILKPSFMRVFLFVAGINMTLIAEIVNALNNCVYINIFFR